MIKNIKFIFRKLSEKLWIKPLISSLISIAAAFLAHLADDTFITDVSPVIQKTSIEDLLSTISSSMLVIAIFAVGAMLSAYSTAGSNATPRSFKLVVADDVSQNALSIFIGSFIYSIVATVALQNGFYGKAGLFILFILTLVVFGLVIITFLRWVERISKLGRLSNTIKKIEKATHNAIKERKKDPLLGGTHVKYPLKTQNPVFGNQIGYVQHINMAKLQELAKDWEVTFLINCIPGTFTSPDKPLLYVTSGDKNAVEKDSDILHSAFVIENDRSFHEDPRFGLIALSEIASRALSPGINDPGTAIAILGSHVRIFTQWLYSDDNNNNKKVQYDRIEVPEISLADMLDDAFRPIARDGADNVEVMLRLQKTLKSLYYLATLEEKKLIRTQAQQAYERASSAIKYAADLELVKKECISEDI